MTNTETGIELASLRTSLDEAETNAQADQREARELIEEMLEIIECAKREGSYIWQTARWARAKHRAMKVLGRQG